MLTEQLEDRRLLAITLLDDTSSFASTATFHLAGSGWSTHSSINAVGGSDRVALTSGTNTAEWRFTNLDPGSFEIVARWSHDSGRASNAKYEALAGTQVLATTYVNQQSAPGSDLFISEKGYSKLGSTLVLTGTTLTIRLSNNTGGTVAADAVALRRVSPAEALLDAAKFDSSDSYSTTTNATKEGSIVPVNTALSYQLSVSARSGDGQGGHYNPNETHSIGYVAYDDNNQRIEPIHYRRVSTAVDTYLAQPLSPGDTTIVLNDSAGWYEGGDALQRSMAWYGYLNASSQPYPDYTYTRNVETGLWLANGIDHATHTITLTSAWIGVEVPAGTAVRNAAASGSTIGAYNLLSAKQVGTTWTDLYATISGVDETNSGDYTKFRPGTAYIKPFLAGNGAINNGNNLITIRDFEIAPLNVKSFRSGETVQLNIDPTGSPPANTYNWGQTGGAGVTLQNANSFTASFIAPSSTASNTLTFQLRSNGSATLVDTINVVIQPLHSVTLNGFHSDPTNANSLQVDYNLSSGVATPLQFELIASNDAIASSEDLIIATRLISDSNSLSVGDHTLAFETDFTISDQRRYFLVRVVRPNATPSSTINVYRPFQNDYFVTMDGEAFLYASDFEDNAVLDIDPESGFYTYFDNLDRDGDEATDPPRKIRSQTPITSFRIELGGSADQFESKLTLNDSSTIPQKIYAGAGYDEIVVYHTNTYIDGGSDTDKVFLHGTEFADSIDILATGFRMGGEHTLSAANMEEWTIFAGNGDDYIRTIGVPPVPEIIVTVDAGPGRDTLKVGSISNSGALEQLILPYSSSFEVLNMSELNISELEGSQFNFLGGNQNLIEELDLRYNNIDLANPNVLPTLHIITGDLQNLKKLYLHGNPNFDKADLSVIGNHWYYLDLAPVGLPAAEIIDNEPQALIAIARALHSNPLKIFEYVRNRIEFEPYYGRKKSPLAVLQSKRANDYDTSNLLIELLKASGYDAADLQFAQTKSDQDYYLSLPHDSIESWLGLNSNHQSDKSGNYHFLVANIAPIPYPSERVREDSDVIAFDHTWVRGKVGNEWINLNPSIKSHVKSTIVDDHLDALSAKLGKHYNSIGELLAEQVPLNPGDPEGYRVISPINADPDAFYTPVNGEIRNYGPLEWYERRVDQWLAENAPGLSIADIRTAPQIQAERIDSVDDTWPKALKSVHYVNGQLSVQNPTTFLENGVTLRNQPLEDDYWKVSILGETSVLNTSTQKLEDQAVWDAPQVERLSNIDRSEIFVLSESYGTHVVPTLKMNGTVYPQSLPSNGGVLKYKIDVSIISPKRNEVGLGLKSVEDTKNTDSAEFDVINGKANVIAIVLDDGQNSEQHVLAQQHKVNEQQRVALNEALPWQTAFPSNTLTTYRANELGAFLSLVGRNFFRNATRDSATIDALFGTIRTTGVNVGFVAGSQVVYAGNIEPLKPNPIGISGLSLDFGLQDSRAYNRQPGPTPLDVGNRTEYTHFGSRALMTGNTLFATQNSFSEHQSLEELTDVSSFSTVKLLQTARKDSREIRKFDSKLDWDYYKAAFPAGNNLALIRLYAAIESEYSDPNVVPQVIYLPHGLHTEYAVDTVYGAVGPIDGSWSGNGYLAHYSARDTVSNGFIVADKNTAARGGIETFLSFNNAGVVNSNLNSVLTHIGDPVNPVSGAFFDDVVDVNVPAIGLPLVFSRHYDSLTVSKTGKHAGLRDLGDGWWHNYSDRLDIATNETTIDWITNQGQVLQFTKLGNGSFQVPKYLKGEFWTDGTAGTTNRTYTYRDRSGLARKFNHRGSLIEIIDQFGNKLELTYNASFGYETSGEGLLEFVTSVPRADSTTLDPLDSNPPIGAIYDQLQFYYQSVSGAPKLLQVSVRKASPLTLEAIVAYTVALSSTGRYRLASASTRAGNVTVGNTTQSLPQLTQYNYWTGDPESSPRYNKLQSIVKFDGATTSNSTAFDYYANGRVFRITDPDGNRQHFVYDQNRLQTTFIDERGNVTRYYFDDNGNELGTRFSDGARTDKKWDAAEQQLIYEEDEGNLRRSYSYEISPNVDDLYDNVQRIDTQIYRKSFLNGTGQYINLYSENFAYVHMTEGGHLLKSALEKSTTRTDTGALVTTWFKYRSSNQLPYLEKRIDGVTTDTNGNFQSALRSTAYVVGLNGLVTRNRTRIWQTGTSNPDSSSDDTAAPTISWEDYLYSRSGQLTKKTSRVPNANNSGETTIDELFRYDDEGRLTHVYDGRTNGSNQHILVETRTYDGSGQLFQIIAPATTSIPALTTGTTQIGYNRRGTIVQQKDANNNKTDYSYDNNQRAVIAFLPDGSRTRTVYDAMSNVTYQTDELGRVVQNYYDSRNRLIQSILPDGTSRTQSYDGRGNQVGSVEYSNGDGYFDHRMKIMQVDPLVLKPVLADRIDAIVRESKTSVNVLGLPIKIVTPSADGKPTNPWVPINVLNPSFEFYNVSDTPTPVTFTSPRYDIKSDTGWADSSIGNSTYLANPNATDYAFQEATEGKIIARVGAGTNITQNLATQLEANTTYLLKVDVGAWASNPSTGYSVELYAGGTILASTNHFETPTVTKEWRTASLYYSTARDLPFYGSSTLTIPTGNLSIRLVALGSGVTLEVQFDNVRLYKRSTIDLNSHETQMQYNVSGQLTSSVDSRIHVSSWQNAANPFDANNDGLVDANDVGIVIQTLDYKLYRKWPLLPQDVNVGIYPDINGDGLLNEIDRVAILGKVNYEVHPGNPYKTVEVVQGTSFTYDPLGRLYNKLEPNGRGLVVASDVVGSLTADPAVAFYPETDGNQVAWTYPASAQNPDAEISQMLTTHLEANRTYTLEVSVGRRSNTPFGDFTVELWAGSQLVASKNQNDVSARPGLWTPVKVVYQSDSSVSPNQALKIKLTAHNQGQSQVLFDNVRLSSSQLDSTSEARVYKDISIVNPSFESNPVGTDGSHNNFGPLTGWTHSNTGLFNPSPIDFVVSAPIWGYRHDRWTETLNGPPQVVTGFPIVGTRETVLDPLGRLSETILDGRGRTLSVTNFDQSRNIVRKTSNQYDNADHVIATVDPRGYEFNDVTGYTTNFTYDERGQLVTINAPDTIGANNEILPHVTRFTYDQVGNKLITQIGPDPIPATPPGNISRTEVTYDNRYRPIKTIRRDNDSTTPNDLQVLSVYDRASNVIQTTDPLGRTARTVYDELNRPILAFNAISNSMTTAYTSSGQVWQTTDYKGHAARTLYDHRDRPVLVVSRDPDNSPYNEPTFFTESTYNTADQLVSQNSGSILVEDLESIGTRTYSTYDRYPSRTWSFQYDRLGRPTLQTDPDPDGTGPNLSPLHFTRYDLVGNKIAEYNPRGLSIVNNALAVDEFFKTAYDYDALNRVTRKTLPDSDYDPNVSPNPTNGPDGHPVWQYRYDSVGNVLNQVDPIGRQTVSVFDKVGLKASTSMFITGSTTASSTTRFSYDDRGNLTKTIDPEGIVTRFEFDLLDRQTAIDGQDISVDSQNQTRRSTTEYDLANNVVSTIDPLDRVTKIVYDGANRPVLTTLPSVTGKWRRSATAYDANGNAIRMTDANGQVSQTLYDNADRKIKVIEPTNETTQLFYDVFDNLISVRDPSGVTSVFFYDGLDRRIIDGQSIGSVISFEDPDNMPDTGDESENLAYLGAANGSVSMFVDATSGDPPEVNTGFTPISAAEALNLPAFLNNRTFQYDVAGNLVESVDRNGKSIVYEYDLLDRKSEEVWSDANNVQIYTLAYDYDLASQLKFAGSLAYTYDYAGRVLSERQTSGPTVTMNYVYRTDGQISQLNPVLTGGATSNPINDSGLQYEYDSVGRLNALKNPTSTTPNPNSSVTFKYNTLDQMTGISRFGYPGTTPIEVQSTFSYEPSTARLSQIKHVQPSTGKTIDRFDQLYDREDRLIGIYSFANGNTFHAYDERDQVKSTGRFNDDLDEDFTYDASGNRTNNFLRQAGTTNSVYGDSYKQNRLQSTSNATTGVSESYTYDKEGNLVLKNRIMGANLLEQIIYSWDYRNRLVRVDYRTAFGGPITKQAILTYDVNDRLISYSIDSDGPGQGSPSDVQRFFYNGSEIYFQIDTNSKLSHRYIGGAGIDQVLIDEQYTYNTSATLTQRKPLFLLGDHQDSVRTIIDGFSGLIAQRMEYNAFGELIKASPSTSQPVTSSNGGGLTPTAVDELFRYTGRPYFDEIDLQNNRARWYDATNARFISTDPSGFDGGDYNLYRYVANNPLMYTDPSGLIGSQVAKTIQNVAAFFAPVAPVLSTVGNAIADAIRAGSSTYVRTGNVSEAFSQGYEMFRTHFPVPSNNIGPRASSISGDNANFILKTPLQHMFDSPSELGQISLLTPVSMHPAKIRLRELERSERLKRPPSPWTGEQIAKLQDAFIEARNRHEELNALQPEITYALGIVPNPVTLMEGIRNTLDRKGYTTAVEWFDWATKSPADYPENYDANGKYIGPLIGIVPGGKFTNPSGISGIPGKGFKPATQVSSAYSRPSGAGPTAAQRNAVQGKPCVDCGQVTAKQVADHKDPLVVQHYREGAVDVTKQSTLEAVQAHCPSCAAKQGGLLSAFSRRMKELFGF